MLLKSIQDIAIFGRGADDCRRTEKIRYNKTLDNLTEELRKHEFTINRSAVYLRLIPRRYLSLSIKLINIYLTIKYLVVKPILKKLFF